VRIKIEFDGDTLEKRKGWASNPSSTYHLLINYRFQVTFGRI